MARAGRLHQGVRLAHVRGQSREEVGHVRDGIVLHQRHEGGSGESIGPVDGEGPGRPVDRGPDGVGRCRGGIRGRGWSRPGAGIGRGRIDGARIRVDAGAVGAGVGEDRARRRGPRPFGPRGGWRKRVVIPDPTATRIDRWHHPRAVRGGGTQHRDRRWCGPRRDRLGRSHDGGRWLTGDGGRLLVDHQWAGAVAGSATSPGQRHQAADEGHQDEGTPLVAPPAGRLLIGVILAIEVEVEVRFGCQQHWCSPVELVSAPLSVAP